ncbi:hypothetical protein EDC01DRAFT_633711 [Geopyxis carbonaria]|nr:hypothetical protein EDC01DRAFT_633711 [Geopyxis carbonaria]
MLRLLLLLLLLLVEVDVGAAKRVCDMHHVHRRPGNSHVSYSRVRPTSSPSLVVRPKFHPSLPIPIHPSMCGVHEPRSLHCNPALADRMCNEEDRWDMSEPPSWVETREWLEGKKQRGKEGAKQGGSRCGEAGGRDELEEAA